MADEPRDDEQPQQLGQVIDITHRLPAASEPILEARFAAASPAAPLLALRPRQRAPQETQQSLLLHLMERRTDLLEERQQISQEPVDAFEALLAGVTEVLTAGFLLVTFGTVAFLFSLDKEDRAKPVGTWIRAHPFLTTLGGVTAVGAGGTYAVYQGRRRIRLRRESQQSQLEHQIDRIDHVLKYDLEIPPLQLVLHSARHGYLKGVDDAF